MGLAMGLIENLARFKGSYPYPDCNDSPFEILNN
jgi:hypothetical protein